MFVQGPLRLLAVLHREDWHCLQLQFRWGSGFENVFFWKCKRYVFAQFLSGMDYTNCIRTEKGYCAIEWKEKTGATPGR